MRRVTISHPRPDCVAIAVGRDRQRAVTLAVAGVAVCGLMALPESSSAAALVGFVLGAACLAAVGVLLARALRTARHTLVRSAGRLVLDTEPLEMARVELKLVTTPILRRPTGYVLSLWVMTAVGPNEVFLGRFPTLLAASGVSGQFEDFVQRADARQRRMA